MRMNIEAERARAGMTKNELSEKLGISQKTYVKYVNGSPISSDVLEKMAVLFMKQHLADSMLAVGKDKISTAKAALSFRKSMQVNITSDVMVPDDLCKVIIDRKPDKTAIGKLLKAGETVPGAELVENMNLQVK